MMITNMKKNELNELEMDNVTGGSNFPPYFWEDFERALKADEEIKREEARKQAEAANQPGAHAHGGGASGGW